MTDRWAHVRYGCVTVVLTAMIAYGSLFPFDFSQARDGLDAEQYLLSTWRDWDGRGDLLSNILLYLPFGFFAMLVPPGRWPGRLRAALAVGGGVLLSASMEMLQYHDVGRVTSMGDVYANAIGSAFGGIAAGIFGAGLRWPYVRILAGNLDAAVLLAAFAGYRLYPYVPVIDLHKYWHAVRPLLQQPVPALADVGRFVTLWLLVAALIDAVYGFRRWLHLFPLFVAIVFLGRILVTDLYLSPGDVIGAVGAFVLWGAWLGRIGGRFKIVAVALAVLVTIARLEPFHFAGAPAHRFGWVPFRGLMQGSIGVAVQAFFEKLLQYGGLIWLLVRAGLPRTVSAVGVAGLLLVTSYAEVYLPGRSGEITDAAMAVVVGAVLALLRPEPRREAASSVHSASRLPVNGARPARLYQ